MKCTNHRGKIVMYVYILLYVLVQFTISNVVFVYRFVF